VTRRSVVGLDRRVVWMEGPTRWARLVDELFNRGNTKLIDEFLAPDYIEREELPPRNTAWS
jgi:hypothetical protein